jgi:CRP/FNR family transcriptional regulator, cyclic AMP receptor protein
MSESLSGIELFRDLSLEELKALSQRCSWRNYPAHYLIIAYGDESNDVYFINKGKARIIYYSASGREVMFRDLILRHPLIFEEGRSAF